MQSRVIFAFIKVPFSSTTPSTRLVVTLPENRELTEQERCLLSKDLSCIPTRAHNDEYTAKADCERFFCGLRLKAYFSSDPSNATAPSQPSNQCEDPFKTLKHSPSNWTPPPGKFAAFDYYISKCAAKSKCSTSNNGSLKQTYPTRKISPFLSTTTQRRCSQTGQQRRCCCSTGT